MLIRINGGSGGIKEYLENGQKQGRFYSRDDLDERIILDGNLSLTETIIESMNVNRNKYFHITLAFKEDYIESNILASINQEFKAYFLAGYTNNEITRNEVTCDEINYYAEVHIPKIKSYMSANDNNLIERKSHIHIVIPTINLLDGNEFYPSIRHMLKYINSFQEHINEKYGLASPKDNLRTNFNNSSEVISRYKGDIFNTKGREQKTAVLDIILENNPTNIDELKALLITNSYAVKLRNKDNVGMRYLNIKQTGDTKGINLKESVFRDEFLRLSPEEKTTKLGLTVPHTYTQTSPPKKTDIVHNHIMQEWLNIKALEMRFINRNISKQERQNYLKLSPDNKTAYLRNKQQQYYQHHNAVSEDSGNIEDASPLNIINITGEQPKSYPEINIADPQNITKDSPVTELINQLREQNKQQIFKNHLHELNSNIQANVLLELTEKTHCIQPELYFITKDNNGADRIKCGKRNLSIVDFCLKELNLPFRATVELLDNVYNMQHDITREQGYSIHQEIYLKEQYKEWFKSYKLDRLKHFTSISDYTYNERKSIIAKTKDKIQSVWTDKNLTPAKRIEQINLLKAGQVIDLQALNKAKKHEQKLVHKSFNLEMQASYRNFLAEQAKLGDEIALKELRRLRIKFDKSQNDKDNTFKYVDRYQEFRLNITYDIDENGTICYKLNDQVIIKDTGKKLEVIQDTKDNIKLSLDLAMTKFGKTIELTGTKEFRENVIETAIKNNYKVEFLDDYSKQHYAACLEQIKSGITELENHN